MNTWFECGVRCTKTQENGTLRKVTELYVVPALSFTEAEAAITKEITSYMHDDYAISTIKRATYSEIFHNKVNPDADIWFKTKVNFIMLNERTGKEKKIPTYMLIQASSTEDASRRLKDELANSVSDYQIASITETNIIEVYDTDI